MFNCYIENKFKIPIEREPGILNKIVK